MPSFSTRVRINANVLLTQNVATSKFALHTLINYNLSYMDIYDHSNAINIVADKLDLMCMNNKKLLMTQSLMEWEQHYIMFLYLGYSVGIVVFPCNTFCSKR